MPLFSVLAAEEAVAAGDNVGGIAAAKGVFAVVIFAVVDIVSVFRFVLLERSIQYDDHGKIEK